MPARAVITAAAIALWPALAGAQEGPTVRAATVFASPVNGGCYIAAPNQCRIHVDPFTINIASGTRLTLFKLQANGVTVYDFRTDVSNPPPAGGTTYTPSLVALDFAARCGVSYVVNVIGQANDNPNPLNMGQTASFTCPTTVP